MPGIHCSNNSNFGVMGILYQSVIGGDSRFHFQSLGWIVFICAACSICDSCSPVNSLAGLNEKLRDLETELTAANHANINLEPIVHEANNRGTELTRATVGRVFVFTYDVLTFNITEDFAIRWEHNGRPVTFANYTLYKWLNDSSGEFALHVEPNLIKFIIHTISPVTLGSYQFFYVDDAKHVMQSKKTLLRPVYDPRDVFPFPMGNVTAVVGETVNFLCYVGFTVSETEEAWNRIVWRHKDRVVYAAPQNPMHPYRNLQEGMRNYEVRTQALESGSGGRRYRLIIKSARESLAGRYECWFQPDERYQDWVVQSAILYVSKS